ncbi:hypothetical protein VNO78_19953 [Psophocarpus tetragonolobus]|uniref:Uncharacterized protein n=1 Tax=Psophocarpus tetragonolobus TaxID=3891 RepID=A0AAN9XGB0_PSOTE
MTMHHHLWNQEKVLSLSIITMSGPGASEVLKATSADPWSASFMVETRTACFKHSNFFKVTASEARSGQLRPGAHHRQKGRVDRCTPEMDRSTQPKVQLRAF